MITRREPAFDITKELDAALVFRIDYPRQTNRGSFHKVTIFDLLFELVEGCLSIGWV